MRKRGQRKRNPSAREALADPASWKPSAVPVPMDERGDSRWLGESGNVSRRSPPLRPLEEMKVIDDVLRRRRFTADHKLVIVAETMQPGVSTTFVARRHGLSPSLVFRWRREMRDVVKKKGPLEDAILPYSETRRLEDRVRDLERVLGRKTIEIELLKEALEMSRAGESVGRSRPASADEPP